MAYKVRLSKRECQQIRCNNKAKYDVFNNRNGLVGEYCAEHAMLKVDALYRIEKELAEAQKTGNVITAEGAEPR